MRTRALALTTALLLALWGAGCGAGGTDHSGTAPSPTAQLPSDSVAQDAAFARAMIPHHEQAIEMADIALARSDASPQVKHLAEQISNAQGPEIELMTRWLESWGAPATASPRHGEHGGSGGHGDSGDHGMSGMMSEHDMAALRDARGTAFDRRWLTMMVAHHQGAVEAAQEVLRTTRNPEVESLANDVIASQQDEIRTMTGMLGTAHPTSAGFDGQPTATTA